MKIAFFDSGMGGLTVLYEALKQMPNEAYLYFADAHNAPYGTKSSAEILALVLDAVAFIATQEPKALVLACNTATSVAVQTLRQLYSFPIIGMEPAIKPAVEHANNKKTLICATDKTLSANKLQYLIQQLEANDRVVPCSLQKLVLFAEQCDWNNPNINQYLKQQFANINWAEFDSIVLGCTHFPYFQSHIRALIPAYIRIIDGTQGTVKQLQRRVVPTTSTQPTPPIEFFISKQKSPASTFESYFQRLHQHDLA